MANLLSTIIKGFLSSERFISGFMGEGWKIWNHYSKKKEDGSVSQRYKLEIDDLTVRNSMTVYELLIEKIRALKGSLGITQACGKVETVTQDEDYFYLTIEEDEMSFMENDIIRCQRFDTTAKKLKGYWVEIVEIMNGINPDGSKGKPQIKISKSEFIIPASNEGQGDESEIEISYPAAGDDIVQFGNTQNEERQSAIYLTTEEGVPKIQILDKITGKSFDGCNRVVLGSLNGMTDEEFKENQPQGYGMWADNVYLKGTLVGSEGYLLNKDGSGYIGGGAIKWKKDDQDKYKVSMEGNVVLSWDNLSEETKQNLTGEDGKDADQLEYIYRSYRTSKCGNPTPDDFETNSDYQKNNWIPSGDSLKEFPWRNVPHGVNEDEPYELISVRIKKEGKWERFSDPVIWAKYGFDGEDGKDGENGIDGKDGKDANLLPWIEKWTDNVKELNTEIGKDYILTPKIFSGTWNGDAPYKGVALGHDVISVNGEKKTGLFGLKDGSLTFSLDSEGNAKYSGEVSIANGKVLLNQDGSGQLANGNISWKSNGDVTVKGDINATSGQFSGAMYAESGWIGNLKITEHGALMGGNAMFDDLMAYVNPFDKEAYERFIIDRIHKTTTMVFYPPNIIGDSITGTKIVHLPSSNDLASKGIGEQNGFRLTLIVAGEMTYFNLYPIEGDSGENVVSNNATFRVTSQENGQIRDNNFNKKSHIDIAKGDILELYYFSKNYYILSHRY